MQFVIEPPFLMKVYSLDIVKSVQTIVVAMGQYIYSPKKFKIEQFVVALFEFMRLCDAAFFSCFDSFLQLGGS